MPRDPFTYASYFCLGCLIALVLAWILLPRGM
jgi:hypothetical protein